MGDAASVQARECLFGARGGGGRVCAMSGNGSEQTGHGRNGPRRAVRKVLLRARQKLQALQLWQRQKRKKAAATAALAFSALLFMTSSGALNAPPSGILPSQGSHQTAQVVALRSGSESDLMLQNLRVTGGATSEIGAGSAAVRRGADVLKTVVTRGKGETGSSARFAAGPSSVATVASNNPSRGIFSKKGTSPNIPLASTAAPAGKAVKEVEEQFTRTLREALKDLADYMKGPKSDTLFLLAATALITPLCQMAGISPILGFLAAGTILGPNALGLISGLHTTETLAELGIVFFLFEMGIELSFERLNSMKKDVFGLGLSQFLGTAAAVAAVGGLTTNLPANALVVLGGGLALSSSAFVLQLLKDKNQMSTRFGRASFGVLLFQDLAVVPLLVVTPILAGGGSGLAKALGSACLKAALALGSIGLAGRFLLNPLFKIVASARSQEAFLGVTMLTVLGMSFMTEGLGLSNTLGAFLAGVLLSETKYRYQIEADIAPFRGILLGLFFITVGFEIDLALIMSNLPLVGSAVFGIVALKALIAGALCKAFGLSLSTAQQTGLILSQSGEFAFVAFGLARSLGMLDKDTTKFLLTCVSLTMAITPALADLGGKIAQRLEENSDFTHYLGQDKEAMELKESDDFVVVAGYGTVGKTVCDLLDRKFIKYVGLEVNPNKAIEARNKGLPVFYGDIGRPEVAEAFNVGKAKAIIVTIADKAEANRAVISLRREYPDTQIFARAADADHAERLQRTLDVAAMVPIVPEDNVLLTLPFGGAVLRTLGAPPEEVNAIIEAKRKDVLMERGTAETEEQAILLQLGILKENDVDKQKEEQVPKLKPQETSAAVDVEIEEDEEKEEEPASPGEVAAAAVEQAKEKTPKVAQVIEENSDALLAEASKKDIKGEEPAIIEDPDSVLVTDDE